MQKSIRFKDIETAHFLDFFADFCFKSNLFEGALLTGSLVTKTKFDCVNDIDVIFCIKDKNILLARDFLEHLKSVLINNIDYCFVCIDHPADYSERAEKLGLIWTSFFLSKKLFGTIDLSSFKLEQESYDSFQEKKIKSTRYFKLSSDFKMNDIFPVIYGHFSLHLAKKFLAVYSYRKASVKPPFFDKESLLAQFPQETQTQRAIITTFLSFYRHGELIEITPSSTLSLGKLAYLIQDLYQGFEHE